MTIFDGSRNVEFLVPLDSISVNERFYVYGKSDSGLCGDTYGYSSPAKAPERVNLYLDFCDLL